jgi:hypothetical protein
LVDWLLVATSYRNPDFRLIIKAHRAASTLLTTRFKLRKNTWQH